LDFGRVLSWIEELDREGCLGVGFGGGEPTLYRRLPELCEYAARKTSLAVSITSHGHFDNKLINELRGNVHFIRISMDGTSSTYESIRQRKFGALLEKLGPIGRIVPFGINVVVNARTLLALDDVIQVAHEFGACELALLPEVPNSRSGGIDEATKAALMEWICQYRGRVRICVSESGSVGLPVCNPCSKETGLRAYAHIDASGSLKRCSYDEKGTEIGPKGIIDAIQELQADGEGNEK